MQKHFAIVSIKDGNVVNRKTLEKFFEEVKKKDGKYQLEASEITKRSLAVNRYYWLILTEYVQPGLYNAGWREIKTKEDAHLFVADMFLKVTMINEESGEEKKRVRSTTELTKTEFNVYLEEIWQWAAEYLGITIPAPNEALSFNY